MRRLLVVAGFLASGAVLVGALAWIYRSTAELEAGQAEARSRAAREERVRLALWRLDSALATFLAQENSLPADGSPPRQASSRPFRAVRFQIDPAGRATPAPGAGAGEERTLPARLAATLKRDALLKALGQQPLIARAEPPVPHPAPAADAPKEIPPLPSAAPAEKPQSSPAAPKESPPAPPAAPKETPQLAPLPPIVREEMSNQSAMNVAEFEQRSRAANAQAAIVPAPAQPPPPSPAPPPPAPVSAPAPVPSPHLTSPPTTPESRPSRPPLPAGETRIQTALEPIWIGQDLVLARRVMRHGSEYLEGCWLDWPAVRSWLDGQIRDLLPDAELLPIRAGEAADPGRRLALLPLRLDAGPLPAMPPLGWSPARLSLAAASLAIVVVAAAAGLLLAASLRLARRRADFVSAVTHELRTPLTTFRLYTEMLDEGLAPPEQRGAYVTTLREEADRLARLVENVLAFARLERGRPPAAAEPLQIGTLLEDLGPQLVRRADREGLQLDVRCPPEVAAARVRSDRFALERILHNLVDNACKYAQGDQRRLELAASRAGHRIVLALRDHGPGIARRDRRSMFRPFHRPAARAAGESPGVGLGLALSRRLARDFGGDLRYREPEGGGAIFELSLPLLP